jgi:hypothetical protein
MGDMTQRFIELLEQDAANYRKAAEAWDELAKYDGRLESIDGKPIAKATDMAAGYRAKEKELRELISKVHA